MIKRILCVFCAVLLVLTGSIVSVAAADKAEYAFLPMEWVSKSQTDLFVRDKIKNLSDAGIKHIFLTVGAYEVSESVSGTPRVDSTVSLKSLPKWTWAAEKYDIEISTVVSITPSDSLFEKTGNRNAGDQICRQISFIAEKLLVDGLSFNGKRHTVDGMHLDCGAPTEAQSDYFLKILSDWDALGEEFFISCTLDVSQEDVPENFLEVTDMICFLTEEIPDQSDSEDDDTGVFLVSAENAPVQWDDLFETGVEFAGAKIK